MIYSYHITHPSELRHDVRKNFEDFLEGRDEETVNGMPVPDSRPIQVQAADLMSEWALFEQQHAAKPAEEQPEPPTESELE